MIIYTVERMDKFYYDFSIQIRKGGCYSDRNKALERAKKMYESICGEYEDEIFTYSDKDVYPDEDEGALHFVEDEESGYYKISFGAEENHEVHSVTVEEWEMEE